MLAGTDREQNEIFPLLLQLINHFNIEIRRRKEEKEKKENYMGDEEQYQKPQGEQ